MRKLVAAATAAFAFSCMQVLAEAPAPSGGPVMLSPAFSPEGLQAQRFDRFAALLDRASGKDDFVGLAVAVVADGEIKLLKTYGVREAGGAEPVTPDTVFRIASLSKGFGASLAALAMDEGLLAPETPVSGFAPRLSLNGGAQSRLTLDHILSHRAGLPPNAYDNLLEAGVAVDDILPRFAKVRPICGVGACYAYQNITFNLVADMLAQTYGAPYESLVRTRIFHPLGMTSASFGAEGLYASGNWARPHVRDRIKGEFATYTPWRVGEISDAYYRTPAAGGVNASIVDMARWLTAQMGHAPNVLPPSARAALHAPLVATPAETRRQGALQKRVTATHYGRGWRIYDYAGHTVVTHSGGVSGYGAQIAWLPERDVGIVVLANTRTKGVFRIAPSFLDIELGLDEEDWLDLDRPIYAEGAEAAAGSGQ